MKRIRLFLGTELPVLAILAFALLPWLWMMLSSIRPNEELTRSPVTIIPGALTLVHHIELLQRTSFAQNLLDSLIVAVGAVTLGLLLALPAAYAFSRYRFPLRRALRVQFLVVNMFPVVLLVLPLFFLLRQFGLLDTYAALIMGHATFTLPFAIWLLTSYIDGIPADLDQAAMMDGATGLQVLRLVILPLVVQAWSPSASIYSSPPGTNTCSPSCWPAATSAPSPLPCRCSSARTKSTKDCSPPPEP